MPFTRVRIVTANESELILKSAFFIHDPILITNDQQKLKSSDLFPFISFL